MVRSIVITFVAVCALGLGSPSVGFAQQAETKEGGSMEAKIRDLRLKILDPVSTQGQEVTVEVKENEFVQIQLSFPIAPPFPEKVKAVSSSRSITIVQITGQDGRAVILAPGKTEIGKIGVGFFSVFVRTSNPGEGTVTVTTTKSDGNSDTRVIRLKIGKRE